MKQFVLELEGGAECSTLSGKRTGSTKEILSPGGWRAQPCTLCIVILSKEESNRRSKFLPFYYFPFRDCYTDGEIFYKED